MCLPRKRRGADNRRVTTQSETYVLDRFEGDWAVLEVGAGETFNVPSAWLPEEAAEGDVLKLSLAVGPTESTARLVMDAEETAARRRQVRALRDSLLKAPEGDLEL